MSKPKKPKLNKKLTFKNPALVIVIVLLVAVGVFFAFKTFASDGTVTSSGTKSTTDKYGCQKRYQDRPTLVQGSTGPCVKTLQNDLNTIKANPPYMSVDGIFGTITRDFVISYQRNNYLTADGIVGQATWQKLYCMAEASCTY